MPTQLIDATERYFFADPASGKGKLKKLQARQAIVGIAVDPLVRVFVIYAWAGKLPTDKYRDKIISAYASYRPKKFGIESNAMQVLFGDLVKDEARKKYGNVRIVPIPSPTKVEKDFKIQTAIESILNNGRLFIPEEFIELRAEIRGFPTYYVKDLIDCLAMCVMMIPKRRKAHQISAEIHQLAEYLRNTGAPSHYINQRVSELKTQLLS